MNVFITGASGFIGQNLCFELVSHGHNVFAATRRFGDLLPPGVLVTEVGEIDASTSWGQSLDGVDVVFHLAGRTHVMYEKSSDPLGAYRLSNVEATLNLARQASEAGVKRFIFLSSIKVNGESTSLGVPFTPEDSPAPLDPYGISKHEAEMGLLKIAKETQMEVVIIRPPLVYGPNVKANFLNMMKLLTRKVPLPFSAITKNKRSLVSLDNLIHFLIVCMHHQAAKNEIFLISDGEDISTVDLMRRIGRALNFELKMIYLPISLLYIFAGLIGKRGLMNRLCGSLQVDISKSCNLLEWKPLITIDQGIANVCSWYLENKVNESSSSRKVKDLDGV